MAAFAYEAAMKNAQAVTEQELMEREVMEQEVTLYKKTYKEGAKYAYELAGDAFKADGLL